MEGDRASQKGKESTRKKARRAVCKKPGTKPKRLKQTLGANGRPVVLANVRYSVDLAALKEYAATEEAARTTASSSDEARSEYTEKQIIERFLQHVVPTASGDGLCTVSYTRSEIGQALVDAGLLEGGRLYADVWPSCVTQLGKKLRAIALGKFYVEMDDKDAFHRLLQARTRNVEAAALLENVITDATLKNRLSKHYFGTEDNTSDVKELLHSICNGGSSEQWQHDHGISRTDHEFVTDFHRAMAEVSRELASRDGGPEAVQLIAERFPTKRKRITDTTGKKKEIELPRDAARCWQSYLLQNDEVKCLFSKIEVASRHSIATGPPLHDCLFVEKIGDLESVAAGMSKAIADAVGVSVVVRVKLIEHAEKNGFQLSYDRSRFQETDFVTNTHLTTQEEIDESLAAYTAWLRRFFVSITDEINPMVAQVYYSGNTDCVKRVVCRTPLGTRQNFLDMDIITEPPRSLRKGPVTIPLIIWYLQKNKGKRTAEHVEMWTDPKDILAHPNDLNIFGGLEFDDRYQHDSERHSVRFCDPFPALPSDNETCGQSVLGPDAAWRSLEGVGFILWHLKFILCGGNESAFRYAMQWFGYIFQKRRKPGVMIQMLGEEGIGKSAIFGHNQSGPGILKRIYGRYFQWSDDIDSLLGKFNALSMDRLFCVMEEAGTYRKGHRDNNKMKSMITEGTMVVEIKNVNAVNKNDNRAFAMLTNNRDSLKVTDGARRFLCVEGNDELSQKAVDEGRCDMETRREYMAKLDRTKNNDDVAYGFFKYCMSLDISEFHVGEPPRTALFEEQRAHNECALKRFLTDIKSGEYPLFGNIDGNFEGLQGEHQFTALHLFNELKKYVAHTGTCSTIDSVMSLGHCLSKNYAALAPKVAGRVTKYKVQVAIESA